MRDTDIPETDPEQKPSALGSAMRSLAAGYSKLRGEDSERAARDREAVDAVGTKTTPDMGALIRRTDVDKAIQGTVDRETATPPDTRQSDAGVPDFEGGGGYVYRRTPEGILIVKSPDGRIDGLLVTAEGRNKGAYDAIVAEMEGKKE